MFNKECDCVGLIQYKISSLERDVNEFIMIDSMSRSIY
jgi:hypothetical protein